MAHAEKDESSVAQGERTAVILELTHDEAEFLADLMACIGGSSTSSRRKYQGTISCALADAGYNFEDSRYRKRGESLPCADMDDKIGGGKYQGIFFKHNSLKTS